jgi:uncharacterized protein YcbX
LPRALRCRTTAAAIRKGHAVQVRHLYRYPVKGLTPEPLDRVDLEAGETVAGDRAYAVENGPSGFDPAAPAWQPKTKFLCWMKNPRLAAIDARLDPALGVLFLKAEGHGQAIGRLDAPEGRQAIEAWLTRFMDTEAEGPLRLLQAPGHTFSDSGRKVLSLINLDSVAELSALEGRELDRRRFRGNLYFSGGPAWAEADWVGRTLAIGPAAQFRVVKMIRRCLATHVDPDRGVRDIATLDLLKKRRGNVDCGVYAEVIAPGPIGEGDAVRVVD